jgi:hypothetical protein
VIERFQWRLSNKGGGIFVSKLKTKGTPRTPKDSAALDIRN